MKPQYQQLFKGMEKHCSKTEAVELGLFKWPGREITRSPQHAPEIREPPFSPSHPCSDFFPWRLRAFA